MAAVEEKPTRLTTEQCRETALVGVLALLMIAYYLDRPRFMVPAMIVLVLAMLVPELFRPLAIVWWGLARIVAGFGSAVLLTIIFAILVTPVGLIRRLFGADSMRFRSWKQQGSVFVERDTEFSAEDLEAPY